MAARKSQAKGKQQAKGEQSAGGPRAEKFPEMVYQLAVARGVAHNLSQSAIAERLGLDQPRVSRLLRDNPFLVSASVDWTVPTGVSVDYLKQVTEILLEGPGIREALQKLSPYGKKLWVEIIHGERVYKVGSRGFDRRATQIISDLVGRSSTVGVAWDLGIKPYSTEIAGFVRRDFKKGDKPIRFIPLCGITSNGEEALIKSATVIAMRYHRLVNRNFAVDVPQLLNLNCIPLVHPVTGRRNRTSDGRPDSADVIKYLSAAFPDYRTIFGDMNGERPVKRSLVDQVDMIFTGCGTSSAEGEKLLDLLYPGKNVNIPGFTLAGRPLTKKQLLDEIVVGDIAGVLLPNRTSSNAAVNARNERITKRLNNRLATLRAEHLRGCCERVCRPKVKTRPGVVLISHGELNAPSVMAAVKQGLVSTLIIDHRLSKEILRLSTKGKDLIRNHLN